jgi:hypothetical protein
MRRFLLTLPIALVAALLTVSPASAQFCDAPPGTSAVDQYCENPPSASGNGGGGGQATPKPSRGTVRAIAKSGKRGEELNRYLGARVASSGGATTIASGAGSSKSGGGSGKARDTKQSKQPAVQAAGQQSTSPLGAVQSAVNSGSTIGNGFIWALIAIALLIAGTAWVRHRRNNNSAS